MRRKLDVRDLAQVVTIAADIQVKEAVAPPVPVIPQTARILRMFKIVMLDQELLLQLQATNL